MLQVIVGVNKFISQAGVDETVPVRQIDNSAVLAAQLNRLQKLKASRDQAAATAALQALENAARSETRKPNLMELAVQVGCLRHLKAYGCDLCRRFPTWVSDLCQTFPIQLLVAGLTAAGLQEAAGWRLQAATGGPRRRDRRPACTARLQCLACPPPSPVVSHPEAPLDAVVWYRVCMLLMHTGSCRLSVI